MVRRGGSVLDISLILMLTLGLIIGVIMAVTVLDKVIDATDDDQIDQDTLEKAKAALTLYDQGIMVVYVGLFVATIVSSLRIPSNPVFLMPAFLFLSLMTWLAAEFSNIIWKFMNVEPFLTTVNNSFPTLVVFINNWPTVTFGLGLAVIVALYMKTQRAPEVGV